MIVFNDVLKRLKEIEKVKTKKDVAKTLGISAPDFHQREKRGTLMPLILEWADNEGVSLDWLMKGRGERYLSEKNSNVLSNIYNRGSNGRIKIVHGNHSSADEINEPSTLKRLSPEYPHPDEQPRPPQNNVDIEHIEHIDAIVGAVKSMDDFLDKRGKKIAEDKKTAIILLLDQGLVEK